MVRLSGTFAMIFGLSIIVISASTVIAEGTEPTATVAIETKAVAVGVGYSWGDGVLSFEGKEYTFKIKGVSVVDLGMSSISAQGDVYHLEKVEDFPGTFSAAEAGIAVGGGAGAQVMKNQNGVVMRVTSKNAGIQLKLAPEGLKVEMN
ncbi:MAG: DUF1134 domain-containing protein [Desulfocapsaceae bacterium]